jgi:hypothetical protein
LWPTKPLTSITPAPYPICSGGERRVFTKAICSAWAARLSSVPAASAPAQARSPSTVEIIAPAVPATPGSSAVTSRSGAPGGTIM